MLSKCFCLPCLVTSTPYFRRTPSPIIQPRAQIQDRLHCSMHAGDRGRDVLDKVPIFRNKTTVYRVSEKDCTLFLFFFLGAQCVESGVSCTDCY
jgi:hypothetical protein